MKRLEFVFDITHPNDLTLTLRFVINIPYVDPADIPAGAILETQFRQRSDSHD